ncbi:AAA family ATPase [Desulfurispora thermophila]|uniref:AAA family ATPase n=1 Tax=Desulfurispora thermophila TaxID=265470 RepID=UPI000369FE70|nr:MoxR family ATPase [Desulfurispora thermophila]
MNFSVSELQKRLQQAGYISEDELAVSIYLAVVLQKPLLVEGAPGVGKTEIARALAAVFDTDLIRLQCYEGLDENKALYEWNYQRQLLKIQILKDLACRQEEVEKDLFSREYLLPRPLLQAITAPRRVVLLIDEVDKVDAPFEAFLFELLSDFQISIPELGTIKAAHIPLVVLTSNGERELSDGLKRRCVYLYIDFPGIEKEVAILQVKVPEAGYKLSLEIARAVHYIRANLAMQKQPSIAETIDWARALVALHAAGLQQDLIQQTAPVLLKNKADQDKLRQPEQLQQVWQYAVTGRPPEGAAVTGTSAGEPGCNCGCGGHGKL